MKSFDLQTNNNTIFCADWKEYIKYSYFNILIVLKKSNIRTYYFILTLVSTKTPEEVDGSKAFKEEFIENKC